MLGDTSTVGEKTIMQPATLIDRTLCDTKSDSELALWIASLPPREADGAIRTVNRLYRAAAGSNIRLDPVNMIPRNPVGELLNHAYGAASGVRPALTAAEIEVAVAWIRANQTSA